MPKSKRKKRSKRNKTGYFGLVKTSTGRYRAQIWIDGTMKYIGTYDTAKEAAKAYDKEAIKLRKPLSSLNHPKKAPVGYTPMQQALRSRNTVGYRGVSKNTKKFQAYITIDGKYTHIGRYDTAKDAAVAYDHAVLKANKPTSLLNFPDMVHNLDVEPKRKKYKRSSTGYRGVTKLPTGKFQVQFTINSKRVTIGGFVTAKEAALAYDQAAIKAGQKKSTLNFPKEEKKQVLQEKQVKEKKEMKKKKTEKKELLTIQEYKEMLQASM